MKDSRLVTVILRFEGLLLFVAALYYYAMSDFSWTFFLVAFFAPDLSLLGYLGGARVGAISYNIAHSTIGPIISLVLGALLVSDVMLVIGVIWLAHIGFDRALGYGLKYSKGFHYTHLGVIGRFKNE